MADDTKPASGAAPQAGATEPDPFDTLLGGGTGGEGLNLDLAAELSGKISAEGSDSPLGDAAKLASSITGGGAMPSGDDAGAEPSGEAPQEEAPVPEEEAAPEGDPAADESTTADEATTEEEVEAPAPKPKKPRARKRSWREISLVFTGIASADAQTAKMSLIFILSFSGIVYLIGTTAYQSSKRSAEIRAKENAAKMARSAALAKKLGEEERLKESLLNMGRFTLELIPAEGKRPPHGIVNMAEVEFVLQCDSPETRHYIEGNFTLARNLMVTALVPMEREDLLSHEGKKKWKAILLRVLNQWLTHGKVQDVYFSKMIIN
ncbi:MAG: flagellar basal body-associated FliL family protein [Bdellovibrio sp.]|nr:flagellar basal body-associated FliL family protein [Bdellovibrio sp.]